MIKWPTTLPQKIRYGDVIKLIHKGTGCSLHSHNISYSHNNTSGQQQVTAFAGADCNDYWTVNRPHGFGALEGRRRPVADHDIIRLDHQSTRKNLHSHVGHPSPITGQQEVTAYGTDGVGDPNDDWRIEVENGGEMARESAYPVDPRFVGMRSSLSQWAQPSTVYRWSAGSDGLYQQGRQRHLVRRKSA
jgi:dolichyl-phosphate-mannose--protein O-mannosyl transferase